MIAVVTLLPEDSFLIRQLPPARRMVGFCLARRTVHLLANVHPVHITLKWKNHWSFKDRYRICTNNSDVHTGAILGTLSYSHYSKLQSHAQHPELLLTV